MGHKWNELGGKPSESRHRWHVPGTRLVGISSAINRRYLASGILAHVAAVTRISLLLDVQLYQSFVVCSQGTGVFVRSIITAD